METGNRMEMRKKGTLHSFTLEEFSLSISALGKVTHYKHD